MSIFKTLQQDISIACDTCGETFVETHGLINPIMDSDGVSFFENADDANEYAKRNGWQIEGDKHCCIECINQPQ